MDRLLSYGPGAEESFAAALEADEGLAVDSDDDANDAVEQWLAESEPIPQPVPAGLPRWSPTDDDILPSRRGRRRSRR